MGILSNDISSESDFVVSQRRAILCGLMDSPHQTPDDLKKVIEHNLMSLIETECASRGIKHDDIADRSNGRISASYINNILNEHAGNLSAEKIVGLADGLDKSPVDVFAKAIGYEPPHAKEFVGSPMYTLWKDLQRLPDESREKIEFALQLIHQSINRLVKSSRKKR